MTRPSIAVLAIVGILGCVAALPNGITSALASGVGVGAFGHISPVTMSGPVTPFNEPRYNLGPGNTAPEASSDSCMKSCMVGASGPLRHARQSCRKSCASTEF